ncbi:PLP-dependent aminotransferase family protein [Acinetobacter pittii]|uniref:aminotransferase-like domain-containing protein n=1 Tax=Acinetobacter pittii TaxID=48296 RepID=UPI0032EAD363
MKQNKTKIEIVISEIERQIKNRSLMPGARLPSVRKLANDLGFSVSTVVEAYERLIALGKIESRTGSGFYIVGPLAPLSLSELGPKLDRSVDPLWISRQSLEAKADIFKPGCGWLPDDWMPLDSIRKALRSAARSPDDCLMGYSTPLGLPALRDLLARRAQAKGIEANLNQVLLTDSGTQAIDLVCRFLLKPDDVVLIDDPCYFNFHALLKVHQVKVIGIPYTPTGPDLEAFKEAIETYNPRLYITNSGIHNPTGAVLSLSTAHQLLKLIEQSNLIVVEDDIFSDFEYNPAPRLAALDNLSRVIFIGSFSKTLSASIRCGYIISKPEWIDQLTDLKIATSFSHNGVSAEVLLRALTDGSYRKHIELLRVRLAKAMHDTITKLEPLGIKPWIKPQAGIFVWCHLPKGVEASEIAKYCINHQVILAPGNAFSQAPNAGQFIRFNVTQSNHDHIYKTLADAIQQESS